MRILFIIIILLQSFGTFAQNPKQNWMKYTIPEEAGFSTEKLDTIYKLCDELNKAALMVVYKGNVLISHGDISRRFYCHSVRKSFTSAIYGIYTSRNIIKIDNTLEELSIDDNLKLSDHEKTAKVEDLLKSRSGIYIPAIGETKGMKKNRPQRDSHKPNTYFYYNNWDFNALGTIFQNETGSSLVEAFYNDIALPLSMEDYRMFDGLIWHDSLTNTIHPKYDFKLSTRDLARFGLLYLNNGEWNGNKIISKEWIENSFTPYSYSKLDDSEYGYLWWIQSINDSIVSYSARGWGGHCITILPEMDMVFVMRSDTYIGSGVWYEKELINLIIEARKSKPMSDLDLMPLKITVNSKDKIILSDSELKKYVQKIEINGKYKTIEFTKYGLLYDEWHKLVPITKTKFFIEDLNKYIYFMYESDRLKFDRIE